MPNLSSIAQLISFLNPGISGKKNQNFKIPGFKKETMHIAFVHYRGLG
jgi:hypothetical protein